MGYALSLCDSSCDSTAQLPVGDERITYTEVIAAVLGADEPAMDLHGGATVVDRQLAVGPLDPCLDRVDGHTEVERYLLVRALIRETAKDDALTGGEVDDLPHVA